MQLSAKIFLENEHEYIFGPGRKDLLLAIAELGSLRKAAQKLGMSYRWAWGRMNNAEKEMGIPLLMRTEEAGGRPKVLTPQARELLQWYLQVEEDMKKVLLNAAKSQPDFLR